MCSKNALIQEFFLSNYFKKIFHEIILFNKVKHASYLETSKKTLYNQNYCLFRGLEEGTNLQGFMVRKLRKSKVFFFGSSVLKNSL